MVEEGQLRGVDVVTLGAIARCHCSVLGKGRVTTNFAAWTWCNCWVVVCYGSGGWRSGGVDVHCWVPLQGANLCFISSFFFRATNLTQKTKKTTMDFVLNFLQTLQCSLHWFITKKLVSAIWGLCWYNFFLHPFLFNPCVIPTADVFPFDEFLGSPTSATAGTADRFTSAFNEFTPAASVWMACAAAILSLFLASNQKNLKENWWKLFGERSCHQHLKDASHHDSLVHYNKLSHLESGRNLEEQYKYYSKMYLFYSKSRLTSFASNFLGL